jgi:hypothetical protein
MQTPRVVPRDTTTTVNELPAASNRTAMPIKKPAISECLESGKSSSKNSRFSLIHPEGTKSD